jgi:hypothetical protein
MFNFYDTITSLENLSLITNIWFAFGTLALIPSVRLIKKHQQKIKIEREKESIKKMRALISEEMDDLVNKVDILDGMIRNLITDVRVLEALDSQDHDRDSNQQKERNYNHYTDIRRKIKRQGKDNKTIDNG